MFAQCLARHAQQTGHGWWIVVGNVKTRVGGTRIDRALQQCVRESIDVYEATPRPDRSERKGQLLVDGPDQGEEVSSDARAVDEWRTDDCHFDTVTAAERLQLRFRLQLRYAIRIGRRGLIVFTPRPPRLDLPQCFDAANEYEPACACP